MLVLLFFASLLLPAEDISEDIQGRVRKAVFGDNHPIGYTKENLGHFPSSCRMPSFHGWIEDLFGFDTQARILGERFIGTATAVGLVKEAWMAGGYDAIILETGEVPLPPMEGVPKELAPPLARFLAAIPSCMAAWEEAVELVDEKSFLGYFEEGGAKKSLALMERWFDREAAGRAAVRFIDAVEQLAGELNELGIPPRQPEIRIDTPYGEIILGAKGKTVHSSEPPLLIIDVSGNDRYPPGSACGRVGRPLTAVIDLRGNDVYESKDESGGAGAGIGGIGLVIDLRGDDEYLVEGYGAGFGAFGAGVVHDMGGEDRYIGNQLCQAVGLCGVGMIIDEKGDDHYELFYQGQGLGFPLGTGLLVDLEGDDIYLARDDDLRNPSPQTAEHNVSMAQGVGYGYRGEESKTSLCGGIGLLIDHAGDDTYQGAVFAQAVGYWYGVGMLFDLEGDDRYEAVYYGQSASAHFALSYLLDAEGNDHYKTSLSQSLGNGRDLSLSVFRDEQGRDTYFAPDRSLGCGDLNGSGLFIDCSGRDTYSFETRINGGIGIVRQELSELRRNFPTVGVFLDLGGDKDSYGREGMKNGGSWTSDGHYDTIKGIGIDDSPRGGK